jgi:rhodanese-related sulfurtransferase
MYTNIDQITLQQLVAQGAQLVEVLPAAEYAEAHLPGAINLPLKLLNRQSAAQLDMSRPVIVYCHDFE